MFKINTVLELVDSQLCLYNTELLEWCGNDDPEEMPDQMLVEYEQRELLRLGIHKALMPGW